jgi:endonuclease/exonuclease/phosphatase (EEP) superfamily protein YafD
VRVLAVLISLACLLVCATCVTEAWARGNLTLWIVAVAMIPPGVAMVRVWEQLEREAP